MFRARHLIALGFAVAAVAAPIAQAETVPSVSAKVDPLAVSYLQGHGFTSSQVQAWTTGACSTDMKPAECFGPSRGADLASGPRIDPLAESYLLGMGMSPQQVKDWTVGVCSDRQKPAVCFASSQTVAATGQAVQPGGFHWADAGIGAGTTLGAVLLFAGLGAALLITRQNRRRDVPST
jgi:hypothetical protein